MQDVLEVVSLKALLRVEELKEFLDKLGSDVDLEAFDIYGFVDNQL
jgi:hypothetical protein